MLWVPTASDEVEQVAWPLESATAEQPAMTDPSARNSTVPDGLPDPGATAETVAVKITDWPKSDGAGLPVTATCDEAAFTVCDRTGEVEASKLVLPE